MHRNGAEDEEKSGGGSTERKRPRSEVGGVAAASTQRAEAVVGEVPWRTLVPTKSGPADQRGGCASKFLVKCRIVGGGPGGAAQGDGGPAKGGDPGAGGEGEGEGEGEAGQAEGEGGGGGGERGGSGDVEVFLVVSDMARVWWCVQNKDSMEAVRRTHNPQLQCSPSHVLSILKDELCAVPTLGSSTVASGVSPSTAPALVKDNFDVSFSMQDDSELVLTLKRKIGFYNFKWPFVCSRFGKDIPPPVKTASTTTSQHHHQDHVCKHHQKHRRTTLALQSSSPQLSETTTAANAETEMQHLPPSSEESRFLCTQLIEPLFAICNALQEMTSGTASSVSPKIINKVKASFEWAPTATTCELYTAYMQSKATTVTSQFNQLPTTSLSFPTAEGDPPGARPLCTSASQSFNTHAEPHFTLELQLDTDETSKLNTSTTEAQDELERRREIEQRMSKHKDNTKKKPKGFL